MACIAQEHIVVLSNQLFLVLEDKLCFIVINKDRQMMFIEYTKYI